jgi:hypothetical protein
MRTAAHACCWHIAPAGAMHPAAPLTPESQQKALLRIAAALDHNNVLREHNWERYSSNDYCSWDGVGCGAGSPSVAALNLDTA